VGCRGDVAEVVMRGDGLWLSGVVMDVPYLLAGVDDVLVTPGPGDFDGVVTLISERVEVDRVVARRRDCLDFPEEDGGFEDGSSFAGLVVRVSGRDGKVDARTCEAVGVPASEFLTPDDFFG
jgi:hypothetical protein